MTSQNFIYQDSTQTIRLMPQNYLIAFKYNNRFVFGPDLAVDKKIQKKIFEEWDFNLIWGGGKQVADKLNSLLTI